MYRFRSLLLALERDRADHLFCGRTARGPCHTVRRTKSSAGNENRWAVVVSTPDSTGIFDSPTAPGPLTFGFVLGALLLGVSLVGHVRHVKAMHRSARIDDLTSLPNRRHFREQLSAMLRSGKPTAVLLSRSCVRWHGG